jgi:hypothetical protein
LAADHRTILATPTPAKQAVVGVYVDVLVLRVLGRRRLEVLRRLGLDIDIGEVQADDRRNDSPARRLPSA